jgi:O-antigen/teichoic acid export membrane protein
MEEQTRDISGSRQQYALHLTDLVKIVKNMGIAGCGELFYAVTIYALNLLLSRFLGAKGVGIYAQATTVTLLTTLLARLGFDGGILRFISIYLGRRDSSQIQELTSFVSRLVLLTSIVLGSGLFLAADVLANSVLHEPLLVFMLRMYALTVPFLALQGIWLSGLQAFQRIDYRVLIERIIQPFASFALLALFLSWGWQWKGVARATILAAVMGSLLAGYFYLYRFVGKFPRGTSAQLSGPEVKEWVSFSYPLLLSGMLAFIIARMATLILGYFRDSAEVGIYDVALKVALLIQLPLVVSNTIFAPMIGEIYAQGNIPKLEALFKVITKWVFIASFLIFSLSILFASPALRFFGPEFALGTTPLFLLAFGQLVNAGTGAVGWMLIMSGHSKLHLINATLSAFLTVVLCYLLVPEFGAIGAAIAVATTLILVNILRLVEVFYLLHIHPYHWDFARSTLAGLMSLGTAYYVKRQIIEWAATEVWRELAAGSIFLILYVVLLGVFQVNNEEKELMRWVVHKITSHHFMKEVR